MSEPQQTAALDSGYPGAGAQLRAAREAQGMHIAALAVALKVPVSRLEALEADRFDLLPDPPFVRALAGSVCRVLKIDPAPVLARLPQRVPQRLEAEVHGAPGGFHAPGARKPGVGEHLARPVVWGVLLLLLAAGALIMAPTERLGAMVGSLKNAIHDRMAAAPAAEAPAAPTPAVEPTAPSPSGPAEAAVAPGAAPAVPPAAPAMAASSSSPASAAAVASPAPSPAVAAAPAGSAPAPAAPPGEGESQVVFQATAESWVKVTDAHGKVLLQKSVAAGGSETATGAAPLVVVVGKADVTQVLVRGKPFDMAAIARNNVARFEVK